MYQGIFGPINFISSVVVLDGEAAYDIVFIDMLAQLALLTAFLVFSIDKYRSKKEYGAHNYGVGRLANFCSHGIGWLICRCFRIRKRA